MIRFHTFFALLLIVHVCSAQNGLLNQINTLTKEVETCKTEVETLKTEVETLKTSSLGTKNSFIYSLIIPLVVIPPVYLHLIFEILSVTRFFFNFEILSLKNRKINLISKLIFAGYTGSKNQVRT